MLLDGGLERLGVGRLLAVDLAGGAEPAASAARRSVARISSWYSARVKPAFFTSASSALRSMLFACATLAMPALTSASVTSMCRALASLVTRISSIIRATSCFSIAASSALRLIGSRESVASKRRARAATSERKMNDVVDNRGDAVERDGRAGDARARLLGARAGGAEG